MYNKALLRQDINTFIIPIASFLILIILSIIVSKIGYDKIATQKIEIETATKKESLLNQKIQTLQAVDPKLIARTDEVILALPDTDSGPLVISQIRTIAQERNVIIDSIGASQSEKQEKLEANDIKKASVNVSLVGDFINILEFVNAVKDIAPIVSIKSISLSAGAPSETKSSSLVSASLGGEAYWSDLPKTIPDNPQIGLTPEQNEILLRIYSLRKPSFTQVNPNSPTSRTNPFSE